MLKLVRCWPWKTLSVHLKYNRNATSKGPQVNNKTIWITNTCRYEKGKITKGSCTERIFQYFNIDYGYDQSVNQRHWVQLYMYKQWYECIILNLSFPNWSTKKIMMVYLYKHRYFFFKYATHYYVRSKNGIFQPISTKCGLGTKCRSNEDWGLSTKLRLRRKMVFFFFFLTNIITYLLSRLSKVAGCQWKSPLTWLVSAYRFLHGWLFLNKISLDWKGTLTTQPCTSKLSNDPDSHAITFLRSPSTEILEIYFCSWNGPKISYIKVAGWSPYIIARNAIKSKKAN